MLHAVEVRFELLERLHLRYCVALLQLFEDLKHIGTEACHATRARARTVVLRCRVTAGAAATSTGMLQRYGLKVIL